MLSGKKDMISVIVPTKNSGNRIEKCLTSVLHQSYPNYEIIVVDGHSSDDTIELASKFPVRIFFEEGGTRASACNVGIAHSKGEIVAFTDDDCVVPENWLEHIAMNFANPSLQVLGGPSLTPQDSTRLEQAFGAINAHILPFTTFGERSVRRVWGCNSAYRKSVIIAAGGFNERLATAEEIELQYRIHRKGGEISYDHNLIVLHYRRANLRLFFRQFYKYGIGRGHMLRDHPTAIRASDVICFSPFIYFPFLFLTFLLNPTLGIDIFAYTFFIFMGTILFLSIFATFRVKNMILFHLILFALTIYVVAESAGHLAGILKR